MEKPERFRSYVVKMVLYGPNSDQRPIRAALLLVVASSAETAIHSVREMKLFENPQEWRVDYVREGALT